METGLHVLLVCKKNIDKMKTSSHLFREICPREHLYSSSTLMLQNTLVNVNFNWALLGFFCTSSRAPAPDLDRSWPIREQRPIDPRPASLRYKFWTELISSLTGTVTPPIPVSTLNSLSANILTLTFNFLQIIILRIWFYFYIANW